MAKLIKTETDYRFYAVELTEEQHELYKKDEDQFWEEFEEYDVEWEFIRDKDGGTDYNIEE